MYGEHGIWISLNLCVGLFVLLLSLLGAVVCGVYRRLSPWLLLAMLGFLGRVVVGIAQQVGPIMLHQLDDSYTVPAILRLATRVVGLISVALVICAFSVA